MVDDSLFINKITAAVLSAGLLAMLSGFAAHMLYSPKELDKPAYMIAEDEPKAVVAKAAAHPLASAAPVHPNHLEAPARL